MKVTGNLNLVEAATAGFEEPWALSMFLGNVLEFESVKKSYMGKRHGYAGLLLSGGNFNIKESTLIRDQWFEAEIKLKGDQQLENRDLHWSFLAGMVVTQPGVITDALQKAVEEKGLFYPPDPGSLESCHIGGNVAENAGGPRAFKYGVTKKYLCGM